LGLSIILARALGPVLQGQIMLLLVFLGLAYSLGNPGLDAAGVYFIGRKKWSFPDFLSVLLPVLLGSSALLLLLLLASYHLFPDIFILIDSLDVLFFACLLPVEIFAVAIRYLLVAREDFSTFNKSEFLQSTSLFLLVILALMIDHRSIHVVMLAYLVNRLFILIWLIPKIPIKRFTAQFSKIPVVLKFSYKPWLANLFGILNVRLDAIMVASFAALEQGCKPEDVGLYTICVLAVSRLRDLQMAIQMTFFPRITNSTLAEAVYLTAKIYRQSFLLYSFLFFAVSLLAYPALFLYGPFYIEAFPTLLLLLFGTLFVRANSGVLSIYFTSIGRPEVSVRIGLVSVMINLSLNLLFIPEYGIFGAALATTIAAIMLKIMLLVAFCRSARVGYFKTLFFKIEDWQVAWNLIQQKLARTEA
jgi:O-antigen/teichoic acid export membrane protein